MSEKSSNHQTNHQTNSKLGTVSYNLENKTYKATLVDGNKLVDCETNQLFDNSLQWIDALETHHFQGREHKRPPRKTFHEKNIEQHNLEKEIRKFNPTRPADGIIHKTRSNHQMGNHQTAPITTTPNIMTEPLKLVGFEEEDEDYTTEQSSDDWLINRNSSYWTF